MLYLNFELLPSYFLIKEVSNSKKSNEMKKTINKALGAKVATLVGKEHKKLIKVRTKPRFYTNTNTQKRARSESHQLVAGGKRPAININDVFINLISTEAAMRNVETANTLVFNVHRKATKPLIKEAFQRIYNISLVRVNTANTIKGTRKAFCKLPLNVEAFDMASKLSTV